MNGPPPEPEVDWHEVMGFYRERLYGEFKRKDDAAWHHRSDATLHGTARGLAIALRMLDEELIAARAATH